MWGNRQLGTRLELPHADHAVAHTLASDYNDVGAALPGVEQQCQGEPRASTDRVPVFELRDLLIGPTVIAVRFHADRFHVTGRIVGPHTDLDTACCIIARSALRSPFAPSGLSARAAISFTICSRCNVAARLSPCSCPLLVPFPAQPINDVAVHRLRDRLHRSEGNQL